MFFYLRCIPHEGEVIDQQSGFDKLAMGDNRRFDVRQEEQLISKSNIVSEHRQALPTLVGKRAFIF